MTLPYQRTNTLKGGWITEPLGKDGTALFNETPYSELVQERTRQSRMMAIIGWHTVSYYLQRYSSEIGRVALQNVRRWLNG